jgi:hypothetical protein
MIQPLERKSFNVDDAEYYLLNHNYIHQRKIDKRVVNTLAHLMNIGEFREKTEMGICHTPDGKMHLVNGQHCLSAIIVTRKPQIFAVVNHICADMKEVAKIYATYDRQRTRGAADAYAAYGLHSELGIRKTALTHFSGGISSLISLCKIHPERKTIPSEFMDYARAMMWRFEKYMEATDRSSHKTGKQRSPVVALSLITASHPRHYEFWNGYTSDDGLRKFDPRKVFLNINTQVSLGNSTSNQKIMSEAALFKTGAYCWNKYISGKPIQTFQMDKALETSSIIETVFRTGWGVDEFNKMMKERP